MCNCCVCVLQILLLPTGLRKDSSNNCHMRTAAYTSLEYPCMLLVAKIALSPSTSKRCGHTDSAVSTIQLLSGCTHACTVEYPARPFLLVLDSTVAIYGCSARVTDRLPSCTGIIAALFFKVGGLPAPTLLPARACSAVGPGSWPWQRRGCEPLCQLAAAKSKSSEVRHGHTAGSSQCTGRCDVSAASLWCIAQNNDLISQMAF